MRLAFRPYTILLLLTAASLALPAAAACVDEPAPAEPMLDANAARSALKTLVADAWQRSQAVGAARLLAEAAASEVDEARAAARPKATLSASAAQAGQGGDDVLERVGAQTRASVDIGAPLWDAGRIERLTDWRRALADAARYGQLGLQEQVALQTVSLALERSRYRRQAEVYGQYARQMGCLVGSLEQIVAADRGRASELVQARKTQQQAELAQSQAASQWRQAEIRLARFVGPALPDTDPIAALLDAPPALEQTLAEAERASEIVQLGAQADAAEAYRRAVLAGQKPQLHWVVSGSRTAGTGDGRAWSAGLLLSVPLLDPAADPAAAAARQRAEAARAQRADALDARRSRIAEIHEQALAARDRVVRSDAVLRDSERVREATRLQWQQLGRRSLFDVMAAEGEHYALQIGRVNAQVDARQAGALLWSLGAGIAARLE
ncbi:MAG TPA: TolC family protein [Methylibium sp.]|nr:TolC family protein [Methylibium sp.]